MAMGTARSVARSLLSAMQSPELDEMPSVFGYRSQLEDVQVIVKTSIDEALRVVEVGEDKDLSYLGVVFLKDVVFEADDLFDELLTLAKQYQLLSPSRKAINYFCPSKKHPLIVGERMFLAIRVLKMKAHFASQWSEAFSTFKTDHQLTPKTRPYMDEAEVIGRQDDLDNILSTLLASNNNNHRDVAVLSIVGIPGVGKTTLAKLVFNHPTVKDSFPLRVWTCVADYQGQDEFDVKNILLEILSSITHENPDHGSTMDEVQSKLQEQLEGQRYLLILDDVWTEKRDQWCQLVKYLDGGRTESWILVTTRSQQTAAITGGLMHRLSGLSEVGSWHLFERTAFASEKSEMPLVELARIGKRIVRGFAGVPLAISIAGHFLYGKDMITWISVQENGLASIQNHIMPVLKRSFYHLESPLKSCLCYCALFPGDYVIEKEMLISLWMAQGYIVPLRGGQSLEDAAQEYFTILLQRCFLEDVRQDAYGEIISCKLHSTTRLLACNVAGTEMCLSDKHCDFSSINPCHLTLMGTLDVNHVSRSSKIRSLLHFGGWYKDIKMGQSDLKALIQYCKFLRTLDLSNLGIRSLPNSIGKLLHLRYLNLTGNKDLKVLPEEITILVNLQTLILNKCHGLTKLPEDLSELNNLRVLDIKDCSSLTCMPCGLGKLTKLHILTEFVLGDKRLIMDQWFGQLEELKALQNLRGYLTIRIQSPENAVCAKEDARKKGAYLSNKVHLNHVTYSFAGEEVDERGGHEESMRILQPHFNIKGLDLRGYNSARMPGWIAFLPNLVSLCLENCINLQYLPFLKNLVHLKVFHLVNLLNMDYIFENSTASTSGSSSNPAISAPTGLHSAKAASLCPFLQQLHLINLPKLKGLFRPEVGLGVEDEPMLISNDNMLLLQQSLFGHRVLDSLIVELRPELESVSLGSRAEELSSWGAGTSSTKASVYPPQKPALPSAMVVDDAAAAYTSPTSVDLQSPQPASPSDAKVVNDALLYRSLFPPEYEFEKLALLQLWLADGIFDEEETAGIFFDKCLAKGHFQFSRRIFLTGEAMYTFTRDMVHTHTFMELFWQMYNRLVSRGSHAVRIEDTFISNDVSPKVSHLSVSCRSLNDSSDLSQFERFKQLRALIFLQGHLLSSRQVPRDFFLSLKLLRTLDLSHTHLEELPSSIGNMKCLRYLDLTNTPIKRLPVVLDCLENLQTLKLKGCSNLSTLPKGMRKLEKLRHLEFDVLGQLRSMPEGMGALTNIRTLSAFIVGVDQARNIRQLKNMNSLSGSFCISELQNVSSKDQAVEAYLCHKSQLRKLELRWSDSRHKDVSGHKEVLSSLQPHASLEELRISCYSGSNWPLWISNTTFCRLVNITLFMCENCTVLPSVGKLPALKSLDIVSFKKLKVIDYNFYGVGSKGFITFPKLERLTIQDMPNLGKWSDPKNSHFPKLTSLSVKQCPKLVSLCTLSSLLSLEKLEITHCEMLASCLEEELPPSLKTFISEECPLIIENARTLKCNNHEKWLELLEQLPNSWIDHQEMSCLNSSQKQEEEEVEEEEGKKEEEEEQQQQQQQEEKDKQQQQLQERGVVFWYMNYFRRLLRLSQFLFIVSIYYFYLLLLDVFGVRRN